MYAHVANWVLSEDRTSGGREAHHGRLVGSNRGSSAIESKHVPGEICNEDVRAGGSAGGGAAMAYNLWAPQTTSSPSSRYLLILPEYVLLSV
jgi:hypothetical protein